MEKAFLFFLKLAKGWEQLSWQVEKNTFSKNKNVKKVHSFEIYAIYASFKAHKYFFNITMSWGALLIH